METILTSQSLFSTYPLFFLGYWLLMISWSGFLFFSCFLFLHQCVFWFFQAECVLFVLNTSSFKAGSFYLPEQVSSVNLVLGSYEQWFDLVSSLFSACSLWQLWEKGLITLGRWQRGPHLVLVPSVPSDVGFLEAVLTPYITEGPFRGPAVFSFCTGCELLRSSCFLWDKPPISQEPLSPQSWCPFLRNNRITNMSLHF
jgi:hypothetical protein